MTSILVQFGDMKPEARRTVVNFLQPLDPRILNILSNEPVDGEVGSNGRLSSVTNVSSDREEGGNDQFDAEPVRLTSLRTANPQASSIPASKEGSRRGGSVRGGASVAGDISMYADVDALCEAAVIGNTLQSTVFLGSLAPKFVGDKKMHLSYQTVIAPTQQYFEQQPSGTEQLESVSVVKVFDGYRQLQSKLIKCGLANLDDILKVPFPQTYSQSALGISLSREQVQQRCLSLNNWMGALLRASVQDDKSFAKDAKLVLIEFFGLSLSKHRDMLKELNWLNVIEMSDSTVPSVLSNGDTVDKDGDTSKSTNVLTDDVNKSAVDASFSVGHDNPPTSIGPLQVLVTLGYLAGKHETDKKLHQTYAVTLKLPTDIEPSSQSSQTLAQLKEGDEVSNSRAVSSSSTHTVARTFDGYRKLQDELVRLGVAEDIEFPQTYSKSKLGMSLTKDEVSDRVAVLNRFVSLKLRRFDPSHR
jgi:hypothetical protein